MHTTSKYALACAETKTNERTIPRQGSEKIQTCWVKIMLIMWKSLHRNVQNNTSKTYTHTYTVGGIWVHRKRGEARGSPIPNMLFKYNGLCHIVVWYCEGQICHVFIGGFSDYFCTSVAAFQAVQLPAMSSRCFHGSGYGIAAPAHPRRWLRSLVACAVGTVAVWATLAVVLGVEAVHRTGSQ